MNRQKALVFSLYFVFALFGRCDANIIYCDGLFPLKPCAFSATVKGGIMPGYYADPTEVTYSIAPLSTGNFPSSNKAKMSDEYKTPWQIGGEIGFNLSHYVMLFFEGNYFNGGKKPYDAELFFVTPMDDVTIKNTFQGQSGWNGFIGMRYFFQRKWLLDRIAPFIGAKGGITHYGKLTLHTETSLEELVIKTDLYKASYCVSLGAQAGFDILLSKNLFAQLTAEVVALGARKNSIEGFNGLRALSIFNYSISQTGTAILFPVTLGIRYQF